MASSSAPELIDDQALGRIRFGRNKFLAAAGGFLFGTAAGLSRKADWAQGACGSSSPCFGFPLCCCCSGSVCCMGGCYRIPTCSGQNPNEFCWHTCNGNHNIFKCCDWQASEACICREIIGTC